MTIYTIALFTGLAAFVWTCLEIALKKTDGKIVSFVKNWIGTFFIFSAAVKLVDPVGFAIKLTDYFNVFKTPFMNPFAQGLSFFVLVLELVIGVALLFNVWKRLILPILLGLILFFTLLTGVSAIFNVVRDCGCFGDFLKISPWTSFIKDVILTILAIYVYSNQKKLIPFFKKMGAGSVIGLSTLAGLAFTFHNYYHLPIWDFRAYKIGTFIPEKMKEIQPAVYENIFIYKNKETGEEKKFINTFPNADKWSFVSSSQNLVEEGIEAPIHDFVFMSNDGKDVTEQLLSFEKPIVLIILHDVSKASKSGLRKINSITDYSDQTGEYNYAFVSSSSDVKLEAVKNELGVTGTNLSADGTMLKTMVRSNPGFVVLKKGVILNKSHYFDLPEPKHLVH